MEFSDLKKYIFHSQGGYRVTMKAAPEQLAEWLDNKPMTKTELIGIEVDHFSKFYSFSEAVRIIAKEYDLEPREVHMLYVSWVSNQKRGVSA